MHILFRDSWGVGFGVVFFCIKTKMNGEFKKKNFDFYTRNLGKVF